MPPVGTPETKKFPALQRAAARKAAFLDPSLLRAWIFSHLEIPMAHFSSRT
jgi:hypothetical protein